MIARHRSKLLLLILLLHHHLVSTSSSLSDWIVHNGGAIHVVPCNRSKFHGGLCVKKPLPLGSIVAVIPSRTLITTKTAVHYSKTAAFIHNHWMSSTGGGAAVDNPHQKSSAPANHPPHHDHHMLQQMILAIFLLEESTKEGKASPFAPYLEALPSNVSHLPIFWSSDTMTRSGLNDSNVRIVLNTIRSHYEESYTQGICSINPKFCTKFRMDHYFWAIGLVRSRSFQLHGNDVVLVPLADTLNHRGSASVELECQITSNNPSFNFY